MLRKISLFFFPVIILLIAIGLGLAAGYVSVTGMAKTFPGAGITMVILMALIECGKFIATTWLHKDAKKDTKSRGFFEYIRSNVLTIVVSVMVVVVMAITSFGIYGFLSHGYMATANELEKSNKKIELVQKKIDQKSEMISDLKSDKENINETIESNNELIASSEKKVKQMETSSDWGTYAQNKDINERIKELKQDNQELREKKYSKDEEIQSLREDVGSLEIEKLDMSNSSNVGEVGPLLYISQVSGYSMDHIVNYLILIIMFVFDPFAIVLLLAANKSFDKASRASKETKKDEDEKIKQETLNYYNTKANEDYELEEEESLINTDDVGCEPEEKSPNDTIEEEEAQEDYEDNGQMQIDFNEKEDSGETGNEDDLEGTVEDNKEIRDESEGNVDLTPISEPEDQEKKEEIDRQNEELKEDIEKTKQEIEDLKNEKKTLQSFKDRLTAKSSNDSIYLKMLNIYYDRGKVKIGDHLPSYGEFKNRLSEKEIKCSDKDLENFLVICNLLKIIKTSKDSSVALQDYDTAQVLISQI